MGEKDILILLTAAALAGRCGQPTHMTHQQMAADAVMAARMAYQELLTAGIIDAKYLHPETPTETLAREAATTGNGNHVAQKSDHHG